MLLIVYESDFNISIFIAMVNSTLRQILKSCRMWPSKFSKKYNEVLTFLNVFSNCIDLIKHYSHII